MDRKSGKKYQLPASVSFSVAHNCECECECKCECQCVCVRTWKASFDWKCRLGGDIELMEVNRCDAKNFPISRQLTALSIWLGLRINKGALRKQAKLDIKKWGYKNGYTLEKYTQQRLPTKGGEYFPCSANKYWNVDISVCSEVSVVLFSNVVNW